MSSSSLSSSTNTGTADTMVDDGCYSSNDVNGNTVVEIIEQCVLVCPSTTTAAAAADSELVGSATEQQQQSQSQTTTTTPVDATTTTATATDDCTTTTPSSYYVWEYNNFVAQHMACIQQQQVVEEQEQVTAFLSPANSTTATNSTNETTDDVDNTNSNNNSTSSTSNPSTNNGSNNNTVVTLKFMTSVWANWVEDTAQRFNLENPSVNVEIVNVPLADLGPNVINEATSKTGLFDGFVTPPTVMGSIVEEDGWADLRPYIESTTDRTADWSDIFLSYRKWISQYQNKVLMYPLDGDIMSLFYRQDILEEFGLSVPRTWEEYNQVAAATHGKVSSRTNQTLIGSCVGRVPGCAGAYYANLVLSSITQVDGFSQGHLFDTSTMEPLLGEAIIQTLQWMEGQVKYGPPDQFGSCVDLSDRYMNDGTCVMTYNWGNSFKVYLNEGSIFTTDPGAKMGVAPTPGSTHVLDRETMNLVPCDQDRCRFGSYYDDIGWVNRPSYLAFGGWSCAVNNYTTPGKKAIAAEFCAFASSREQSDQYVAENATTASGGADPFRISQLDVDKWVDNGYQRESVQEYFDVISSALASENTVTDIRFPTSSEIYAVLDEEVTSYLNFTSGAMLAESEQNRVRKAVMNGLNSRFDEIIDEYNMAATTSVPLLEQYQKLRNVFTVDFNLNQLGKGIRSYGFTVASLSMATALFFAVWTWYNRKSSVVRASQPFFLILICLGAFVLASAIIPMAIDDGFATNDACSRACMSIPWLLVMGFSIIFSALYAKIRRVNLVISNAVAFRHIKVTEKDVMLPFAVLFTANVALLTSWTATDPLRWERIQTGPTSSYGVCTISNDAAGWKVIVSLIAIINGAALIAANVEAYKARKVDTSYGESTYIGLIMGSWLQILLVGLPLSFLVSEQPTARFFVNSSMAFIMTMSVLSLLFVPKWINWKRQKNQANSSNTTSQVRSVYVSGLSVVKDPNNIDPIAKNSYVEGLASGSIQGSKAGMAAQLSSNSSVIRSYDSTWKERVLNLEQVMREAGIDARMYLQEANMMDEHGVPISITSTDGRVAVQSKISRSSVESSLNAISESDREIDDDDKASKLEVEAAPLKSS